MTSRLAKIGWLYILTGIVIEFGFWHTWIDGWILLAVGMFVIGVDLAWYESLIRPKWSKAIESKIPDKPSSPVIEAKIKSQNCSRCGAPASNTQKCVYCGAIFMEVS